MNKIAIFGVPRSGTSWLSQIFNSHPDVLLSFQPLFSYGHKGKLSSHSTRYEIELFFEEIAKSHDSFANMKTDMHRSFPLFQKAQTPTHIAFKEVRYLNIIENILQQSHDIKIVGIVRDPLACLASWIRAPKEFKSEWSIRQEWRMAPSKNQNRLEEYFGFDKWKETTSSFLRYELQYPNQFMLARYDELKDNPTSVTTALFQFCRLPMHAQVLEFIKASRSTHDSDPYSVFRSEASDNLWQDVLSNDIVDEVMHELRDTPLQLFLAKPK